MATLGLCDTVRVRATAVGDPVTLRSISGGGSDVPADANNLVVRALERLRDAAGVGRGAAIDLVKRIPSQAGLGGGSSDAAAALVAGARVWGVDWRTERLAALGATLGSDIPFFVHRLSAGASAYGVAAGRGEKVVMIAAPSGWPVVVVKPRGGLATGDVFAACRPEDYGPETDACRATASLLRTGRFNDFAATIGNGLQAAAYRVAPWLGRLGEAFRRLGCAGHQLSGSGSAYFGLTRTFREARGLAASLRAMRLGETFVTSVV